MEAKPEDETEKTELVSARDILEKIQRGKPVEIDNVIIEGNLYVGNLDLPTDEKGNKHIKSKIEISRSIINGVIVFSKAVFEEVVSFNECIFKKDTFFHRSKFNKNIDFWRSSFRGDAIFDSTILKGSANFSEVSFGGGADFNNTLIINNSYFDTVLFRRNANFTGSRFIGDTTFWASKIEGIARFNRASFEGDVNFRETIFGGYADFIQTKFKGKDNDFMHALFKSTINFHGAKFSYLAISWHSIEGKLIFDEEIYAYLIKNFEDMNSFSDANNCYFEYRKKRPKRDIFEKVIDKIFEILCGYGVRPLRPLFLIVLLIFISATIFYSGGGLFKSLPTTDNNTTVEIAHNQDISFLDALYFSFTLILKSSQDILNDLHNMMGDFYIVDSNLYKYLSIIISVAGWLLLLLSAYLFSVIIRRYFPK